MGIAVPSQLRKASHQLNMALIGYSGLGLAGYGWAGLGGLVAPLAIHRDGPFLCGNGEHLINGLCKKKRSAEAEPEAYYGAIGWIRSCCPIHWPTSPAPCPCWPMVSTCPPQDPSC